MGLHCLSRPIHPKDLDLYSNSNITHVTDMYLSLKCVFEQFMAIEICFKPFMTIEICF